MTVLPACVINIYIYQRDVIAFSYLEYSFFYGEYMKLSALRYLVAFADESSFSRAAEQCQVSQPTLSVAIQNLETEWAWR